MKRRRAIALRLLEDLDQGAAGEYASLPGMDLELGPVSADYHRATSRSCAGTAFLWPALVAAGFSLRLLRPGHESSAAQHSTRCALCCNCPAAGALTPSGTPAGAPWVCAALGALSPGDARRGVEAETLSTAGTESVPSHARGMRYDRAPTEREGVR